MTFFKVSAPVYPPPYWEFRTSTNESMVGVFGVSKTSSAGKSFFVGASKTVFIASTFAA